MVTPSSTSVQPWVDGYFGHEIVILDDYKGTINFQVLMQMLDRYPMKMPIKGGFVEWCPRKVIITSNTDPLLWYLDINQYEGEAFARRITSHKVESRNQIIPLFE